MGFKIDQDEDHLELEQITYDHVFNKQTAVVELKKEEKQKQSMYTEDDSDNESSISDDDFKPIYKTQKDNY